jgi:hypothetical protein
MSAPHVLKTIHEIVTDDRRIFSETVKTTTDVDLAWKETEVTREIKNGSEGSIIMSATWVNEKLVGTEMRGDVDSPESFDRLWGEGWSPSVELMDKGNASRMREMLSDSGTNSTKTDSSSSGKTDLLVFGTESAVVDANKAGKGKDSVTEAGKLSSVSSF